MAVEKMQFSLSKAEEDREEALAAELLKGDDETTEEVVYIEYHSDSDDDPQTYIDKLAARFEECIRVNRARRPWLEYKDYSLEEEEEEEEEA